MIPEVESVDWSNVSLKRIARQSTGVVGEVTSTMPSLEINRPQVVEFNFTIPSGTFIDPFIIFSCYKITVPEAQCTVVNVEVSAGVNLVVTGLSYNYPSDFSTNQPNNGKASFSKVDSSGPNAALPSANKLLARVTVNMADFLGSANGTVVPFRAKYKFGTYQANVLRDLSVKRTGLENRVFTMTTKITLARMFSKFVSPGFF
ncbi:hypothetical protein EG68_04763 [Paragonimus skrjabini miyazakii]|uniref:Uncharacterized protein n=1 Tax=Paragonimus skrjabini miyazakii TaxID=59628 RepID=A0A8S9YT48_9TREM|nr:hypothetical protein EG68_04763 [Paragonimus skrjabini miyazakii]